MGKPIKAPPQASGITLWSQLGPNSPLQTNEPVNDYILDPNDDGDVVYINSPLLVVCILPPTFSPGYAVTVVQEGAGQVAFIPAGNGTLQSLNGHRGSNGQYGVVILKVRANPDGVSADWRLHGDLAAANLGGRAALGVGGEFNLAAIAGLAQLLGGALAAGSALAPRAALRQAAKPQAWSGAASLSAIGQSPH